MKTVKNLFSACGKPEVIANEKLLKTAKDNCCTVSICGEFVLKQIKTLRNRLNTNEFEVF